MRSSWADALSRAGRAASGWQHSRSSLTAPCVHRLCDRTDAKEAGRIVGSCYQMLLGAPFSFLDTKEAPDSLVSW